MAFDWNAPTNSVEDTAPLFGIVPWTFYRWIPKDDCPVRVLRVGRKLRVVTESVRRVLLLEEVTS
jgi:hypothetical protein